MHDQVYMYIYSILQCMYVISDMYCTVLKTYEILCKRLNSRSSTEIDLISSYLKDVSVSKTIQYVHRFVNCEYLDHFLNKSESLNVVNFVNL